ncbi:unnamed protein product [Toxocara canis]|uniref:Uncharacterized protein n=1 Tax=Toxocara canis TaxID=6265 RepID=A0A3P7I7U0_TOXCA|nr:unnamed protein product [Toxocara canis]
MGLGKRSERFEEANTFNEGGFRKMASFGHSVPLLRKWFSYLKVDEHKWYTTDRVPLRSPFEIYKPHAASSGCFFLLDASLGDEPPIRGHIANNTTSDENTPAGELLLWFHLISIAMFPCFICEEQQRYEHDDDDETLEELIERDEQEGFLAVEEMDDQLVDISSNIWKKPQTNIHALTNDIEQLRDSIQNSSITLDAAEERLKTAKSRYDAVTLERETNERSALKHWIQLPTMRHRLLKFEQRLLTNDVYGSNRSQIVKIDKMRTTINDIAVQLRGVYEYYFISDEDLVNAGLMLSEAESEMQKRRALLPTEKPKQKCFWFICI